MKTTDSNLELPLYTAFEGPKRLTDGGLHDVALKVKKALTRGEKAPLFIFDNATGKYLDIDFRGSAADVLARLATRGERASAAAVGPVTPDTPRSPGRPKLGVIAREVTLLPEQWDWLSSQPGGASVAIRKLVTEARRTSGPRDRKRRAQERAYQFALTMAGDEQGFEEAMRALFAGDAAKFATQIKTWPKDVRGHVQLLAAGAW